MSTWKIEGYDTFSCESYALGGNYASGAAAEIAAWKRLRELEITQPHVNSGGQGGIQDRVYIICPDGTKYLYEPRTPVRPGLFFRLAYRLGWGRM
jgi:hypothetical protein